MSKFFNNISLDNFLTNQHELREKLVEFYVKSECSVSVLSEKIDINPRTLNKFLKKGEDIEIRPLLKIKAWFEKQLQ